MPGDRHHDLDITAKALVGGRERARREREREKCDRVGDVYQTSRR